MKVNTNISIDSDLKKRAKEQGLEISGLTEWAIREKLGEKTITININDPENCAVCGKEQSKAFAINHNKISDGLTWLWPDEIWICDKCLGWHR